MTEMKEKIDRYVVERELGRGGMAIVYKGFDPRLERPVAIKLIKMNAFPAEMFNVIRERFEREAKALAKLNHPNIVRVHDYGEHEGAPFLVMDYIEGVTLKEIKKPIRVDTAVRILKPIAEALSYVHEKNILHRDVKPSNIMITKDEMVILTDFGIAKWIESEGDLLTLTTTGVGIGTPEYMSPEQGRGEATDGRTDMYALSIVFYELITGEKPFQGKTPFDTLFKQSTDPIPDPRKVVPEISVSVKRFLDRALAKDPSDRYPTIQDYLRDFEGLRLQSIAQATNLGTNLSGIRTVERSDDAPMFGSSVQIKQADIDRIREASTISSDAVPSFDEALVRKKRSPWLVVLVGFMFIMALVYGGIYLRSGQMQEGTYATSTEKARLDATERAAMKTVVHAQDLVSTEKALFVTVEQAVEQTMTPALEQEQIQAVGTEVVRLVATEQLATQTATPAQELTKTAEVRLYATEQAATQAAISVQEQNATAEALVPTSEPNPYALLKIGDIISFGHYEQDNNLENGQEAIEWRVLDVGNGSAVLMSLYGLDCVPYNFETDSIEYKDSSLHAWLQKNFFEKSFSADEQKLILKTKLNELSLYDYSGNNSDGDFVLLLNMEELRNYFSSSEKRQVLGTDYAKSKGAWTGSNGVVWWWVRSDVKSNAAPAVKGDGAIDFDGREVSYRGMAIRPAIRIQISDFSVLDTTEDQPLAEQIKDLKKGDFIQFGRYYQDASYLNGSEPIEWKVLDVSDGRALLLSNFVLSSRPFHDKWYGNVWEFSALRNWLKEGFYNFSFNEQEKTLIDHTYNNILGNVKSQTDEKMFSDPVFLLSLDEVNRYLPSEKDRLTSATAYAILQGYSSYERSWWLRSPGGGGNRVVTVYDDGSINTSGYEAFAYVSYYGPSGNPYATYVHYVTSGVRPAIWLKIK